MRLIISMSFVIVCRYLKYKYKIIIHKYNILFYVILFFLQAYIFKAMGGITLKYATSTKMNQPCYLKWTNSKTI